MSAYVVYVLYCMYVCMYVLYCMYCVHCRNDLYIANIHFYYPLKLIQCVGKYGGNVDNVERACNENLGN